MTDVRHWLLTNTFYGNWLPGDERGFVGNVWDHRQDDPGDKKRIRHNHRGTDYDESFRGLRAASADQMKGPPIHLAFPHAQSLLTQFRETAGHRKWELSAVAIMYNHVHIVVCVPGDPDPAKVLSDFKSWGTRKLSATYGEPPSKTWWTAKGSTRKKATPEEIADAIDYVLNRQPNPLVTWPKPIATASGPA